MSWRTRKLKLTDDQKERGVIYSSELIVTNAPCDRHCCEVFDNDPDKWRQIMNLEDVSFFKNFAKEMGWNVINEVRR